jgi:predicted ribosome quality control (RQC) complex YloA/Tae2 family protein
MKEEMTSVDVAAIVSEFNTGTPGLLDAKIGKIYQTSNDEIRITLSVFGQGRHNLVIQAGKRMHLTRYPRPAPQLPQGFPMLLRKHIMGGRIKRVSQHDFDRIIELEIIRAGITTRLISELFARGNIILTDDEGRILQPMKPVSFRDRTLRRGEIYELPPQMSPLDVSPGDLTGIFSGSDSDVVRTLATRLNMGGVLAEEVCLRSGIDKATPASEMLDPEILHAAMDKVFGPISEGKLEPQVVVKEGRNIDVLPFGLMRYKGFETRKLDSFNQALDEYFSAGIEVAAKKVAVEQKKEGVLERRLRQQQQAIEKFTKQQGEFKEKGELLYAHYQSVEEILNIITEARQRLGWDEIRSRLKSADIPQAKIIRSIDPGSGKISLELDGKNVDVGIKLTVPQNAQVYYDKAKKVAGKRSGARRAILQTEELIRKKQEPERPRQLKGKVKVKPRWYDHFRWFESSDGFLVVGGRDAGTNEEVVKKYMEKRDIFFHTEAPGSPVVVVKTEGKDVPQTTLDEAAMFVVSNSGVWKSGRAEGDCYWVTPEQVSKTPESGEFVPRGSFIIRGKRNYMTALVGAAVGIQLEGAVRLVGGPPGVVRRLAQHVVEVEPGGFSQNDIAKKVYKMLVDEVGDRQLVKSIASADRIAMMLPPGESSVRKGFKD